MIVIGADTHKSTHALAAVDAGTGELRGEREIAADDAGHCQALRWAHTLDPEVVWALEDCRHVSHHLERALVTSGDRVIRVSSRTGGGRHNRRGQTKADKHTASQPITGPDLIRPPGRQRPATLRSQHAADRYQHAANVAPRAARASHSRPAPRTFPRRTHTSSTKPEGDAGSGTNTVSVSPVTITELQANSTYHYRIVATNVTGTATYGADHEFTTVLTSTPVPVLYPTSGNQYVYYRGTNGQLYFWLWNASKESWTLNWEESSHAMAGDPSAVLYPNGNQYVYYRGTDGKLYFWLWNAGTSSWGLNWLESGHPMAGEPSAVLYPTSGNQYVYYRGTDGRFYFWLWNATTSSWSLNWLGSTGAMGGEPGGVMSGTSPGIAALPGGGYVIAFQANKGELWTYASTGEYHNTAMGGDVGYDPGHRGVAWRWLRDRLPGQQRRTLDLCVDGRISQHGDGG